MRSRLKFSAVAVASCYAGWAFGLPIAPQVVHGQASFATSGNALNITNSPNAIINWQGFSIGAGELTRFIQQNAQSAVLNRVVGQDPSAILGQLLSNGRVFLINPSGITFGAGAQIDVAGLVASSLHLSDADFLAGRLQFKGQGSPGSVVNNGEIRTSNGGGVVLIAPRVENNGLINTPGGDILLAAGRTVEIADISNPNIRYQVSAPEDQALNMGKLLAAGGRIAMQAGVVRNSGRISADAAVVENGRVVLRRATASDAVATTNSQEKAGAVLLKASAALTLETGSSVSADGEGGRVELVSGGDLSLKADTLVSATGVSGGSVVAQAAGTLLIGGKVEARGESGPGGSVRFLGNRIALLQRSRTDVSGASGGGVALIGGGVQGNDASMQNASRTVVSEGAEIRADALESGDGGTVVLWSDDVTRYHGSVSARGAGQSGRGGFVEVSGKGRLEFAGAVDVSSTSGRSGTLLLDPTDITLTTTANAPAFNAVAGDTDYLFADDGASASTLNVSFGGSFANVSAGANVVLQASNNITVANAFDLGTATGNSGVSLTLQANNAIAVNAAVTTNGAGTLTLIADHDNNGSGVLAVNANLGTAGGAIALQGSSVSLAANTVANAGTGDISVNAKTGTLTTNAGSRLLSTGNIGITADNVALNAASQVGGSGAAAGTAARVSITQSTAGRQISLGAAAAANLAIDNNELNILRATDVRIGNASSGSVAIAAYTSSANFATNALSITTGGAVTQSGILNLAAGTSDLLVRAGGAITLTQNNALANVAANSSGGAVSVTNASGNNLRVVAIADDLGTVSGVSGAGTVTLSTSGTGGIVQSAAMNTSAANLVLSAGSNGIVLNNASNDFGTVRLTSTGAATLVDANAMNLGGGATSVTGTLSVTGNGALGIAGSTPAGNFSATTNGGAVTQTAALIVAGTSSFDTGSGDLTLLTPATIWRALH
ncbi:MAG: filamentous hemagglutinin N-terminal domain-containing protein [Betaproteobacteria bacterium]|nr:filamentous hemagglutinin N-terminal domain-containing protein [Betaproteobacteria bacterium]